VRTVHVFLAMGVVVGLAVWSADAVEVKLTVTEPTGVARTAEPVTSGVPFAKGAVKDVGSLSVTDAAGKPLPAQFIQLTPWPDGSVRWALMDTQVDVGANAAAHLIVKDGKAAAPANPVVVENGAAAVTVSTGPLAFAVSKTAFNLFTSLKVDGREMVTSASKGLVLYTADGKAVAAGGAPTEVKVEQAGPMRAVVCVRGTFPGVHNGLLRYTVRITAYAGKKFVKVHAWLENQGRYGFSGRAEWFNFDGLAVDLALGLGGPVRATCEGASTGEGLVVEQRNPTGFYSDFAYAITADGKEVKRGGRTDGVVTVSGAAGTVTTAIRHFWQNYEKAIEVTKGGALRLWLWPRDGEWPRGATSRSGEFRQFCKPGLYALDGARHKGYEAILDFSGRTPKVSSATLSAPLMALAAPAYYAETEAVNGWFAPPETTGVSAPYNDAVTRWNAWQRHCIERESPGSLYGARRSKRFGRWYGWHDFGDLMWQPGCSSLHYDWTWLMLLNYVRMGDRGFLDIGAEMARHRIDLDQIWSDRVQHHFRGLTFYEKGYQDIHGGVKNGWYKPIPSHNWVSGVVLYYFLTGEEKAKECALRNGMGLKLRQVDPYAKKPSAGGQTRSSGWAILCLTSLYDLTADKKYLDWAMTLFNNHFTPQWREKGPYLQGGLSYYYSTQGLCELHHRTGDENVLKLLKEGCEKIDTFPRTYGEWKIFLSNVLAYVGYTTNNAAYIRKAEDLFTAVIPKGPKPTVFTGNGGWTKESGKPMRNGHILQYVLWRMRNR